jgi:purine-binding chemotaxis protein CheW
MEPLSDLLVVFAMSGRRLALPADAVAELVHEPTLVRAPAMPTMVAGVFSLRGRVVAVLRLDRLLELPAPATGPFRVLVILSEPNDGWALLVERVEAVVSAGTLEPAPSGTAFDDCVAGMAPLPEGAAPKGSVVVLAAERLLRRRETQALADFTEQAARRWEELCGGVA